MNYTQLIAAVQSYDPGISSRPDIPLATLLLELEADLQPQITHYLAETTATLTSAGNYVTLPSDFIEARQINIGGNILKPVSIYGANLSSDEIGYVKTGNKIQLVGTDGTDQSVEITYFARFPSLSDASPTNWLLDRFPGVYIHGLLARAYRWLKDPNGEGPAKQSMLEAQSAIAADHARYINGGNQLDLGDWYAY